MYRSSGTVNLRCTLLANNMAGGGGAEMSGTFNSQDYNLIENTSGYTLNGTTTHNVTGTDPALVSLGYYGGPTRTHAFVGHDTQPSSSHPALDQALRTTGDPTDDQRGSRRPYDASFRTNAVGGDGSDIGAYEWSGTPLLVQLAYFDGVLLFNRVILEWETEAEIDNAGFDIVRQTGAEGALEQINTFLIPADGGPTWGSVYFYTDHEIEPGQTYIYWLRDTDFDGNTTLHGPLTIEVPLQPQRLIIQGHKPVVQPRSFDR